MRALQEQHGQHEADVAGKDSERARSHEGDFEQLQCHDDAALRVAVSCLARIGREQNIGQHEKGAGKGDQPVLTGHRRGPCHDHKGEDVLERIVIEDAERLGGQKRGISAMLDEVRVPSRRLRHGFLRSCPDPSWGIPAPCGALVLVAVEKRGPSLGTLRMALPQPLRAELRRGAKSEVPLGGVLSRVNILTPLAVPRESRCGQ